MNAAAKTDTSTFLSQDSLVNYGFKRAYGNAASGYILMFDGVGNESGRRIYVPGGSLGMHFAKLVKMQGEHTEKLILSRLSRLRSCAGGFQSYSNKHDAFEHIDIVENLRISYIIRQDTVGGLGPGIYITDIEFVNHAKGHTPGLYHIKRDKGTWNFFKLADNHIETAHAAINGMAEDMEHAATEVMPDIIAGGYKGEDTTIAKEGYTLAYNPRPLYTRGTSWTSPEQKTMSADFTALIVAKALYDADAAQQAVNWTIHGDGAELFLSALEKLPRHFKLTYQTVYLGGPSGASAKIAEHIRFRDMKTADEAIKYQSDDFRDTRAKTLQLSKASKQVRLWGESYKTYSFKLKGQARKDKNLAITHASVSLAAGLSMGGILAAVAGGVPAHMALWAGLGGAGGLGGSAFYLIKNAELIRNLFGTYSMNPEINPHMNPHVSSADFNASVEAKYGGLYKSFVGVIKQVGKR